MLRPCLLTLWGENFLGSTLVGSACNKFFHKEIDGAVTSKRMRLFIMQANYASSILFQFKTKYMEKQLAPDKLMRS